MAAAAGELDPRTYVLKGLPMRYAMFMYPGIEEADWTPDAEAVAAMTAFNEELTKAGVLLALDGLHPPAEGARVRFAGGQPLATDGPFAETKEIVGGYWLIDVASKQDAVDWAKRCPAGEHDMIEVRRVFEMADFPEDVQAAGVLSTPPPEQTAAS
ncbi:MAG TPA: YciI family protein [Solirubrobacteraceae bacterium]|nr:YciI family protein [Solirubrobacteraceae bacterium]